MQKGTNLGDGDALREGEIVDSRGILESFFICSKNLNLFSDSLSRADPLCFRDCFIEKRMRLKVNSEKSAVGRPWWDSKYLGFCLTNSKTNPKIRIHWKTIKRFRERVREITSRRRGRSMRYVIGELMDYIRGWWNYYGKTESFNRLRPLAHWIRRRLRAVIWKHWKNRRTRVGELLKRGIYRDYAVTTGCARKGPWV